MCADSSGDLDVRMASSYNDHSQHQQAAQRMCDLTDIALLLGSICSDRDQLVVVDYGCATGGNSITPLLDVITCLSKASFKGELSVYLNDLDRANLELAKATVESGTAECASEAGIQVRVHTVMQTFFRSVAAPRMVHLGLCFSAVHWVSQIPGPIAGPHLLHPLAESAENDVWQNFAERDWLQFLQERHRELETNGLLAVLTFVDFTETPLLKRFVPEALLELERRGSLSREAMSQLVFPEVFRSESQLKSPFCEGGALHHHFRIEIWKRFDVPDPLYQDFVAGVIEFDNWRESTVAQVRAFTDEVMDCRLQMAGVEDGASRKQLAADIWSHVKSRLESRDVHQCFEESYHWLLLVVRKQAE